MSDLNTLILEKTGLQNEAALTRLLQNSLQTVRMINKMPLEYPVTILKLGPFLKGLAQVVNGIKANEAILIIGQVTQTIFEAYEAEMSIPDSMVLYELRELGKFRIKDDKLFTQLEKVWKKYPEFTIAKDDFKYSLYRLKDLRLIDIRRGSITLNDQVVLDHIG